MSASVELQGGVHHALVLQHAPLLTTTTAPPLFQFKTAAMASAESEDHVYLNYAPTGRASCKLKSCKGTIEAGALRVGKVRKYCRSACLCEFHAAVTR
jgi:hypothetical protein